MTSSRPSPTSVPSVLCWTRHVLEHACRGIATSTDSVRIKIPKTDQINKGLPLLTVKD